MHVETVAIERVFDIQRRKASRYAPARTDFSFEAGGAKHYGVQVPGWPELSRNQQMAFVLRQANNWQSVVGFKNLTTGEVVISNTTTIVGNIVGAMFIAPIMWLYYSISSTSTGRGFAIAAVVVCLVAAAMQAEKLYRTRAARLILEKQ